MKYEKRDIPTYTGRSKLHRSPVDAMLIRVSAIAATAIVVVFVVLGIRVNGSLNDLAASYERCEIAEMNGDYEAAYRGWIDLGDYKDASERAEAIIPQMNYQLGIRYYAHGEYIGAIYYFSQCRDYLDSMTYIESAMDQYIAECDDAEVGNDTSDIIS